MSDDCCGDTGGDCSYDTGGCCDDTGGGCNDTGGGCDDTVGGACQDSVESTHITFTENAGYDGGYYCDGGDTYQPVDSNYSTKSSTTCAHDVGAFITIFVLFILFMICKVYLISFWNL